MKRSVLSTIVVSLAVVGACEKKSSRPDPSHSHGSAKDDHDHRHDPAPADAAPGAQVATGPFRLLLTSAGEVQPGAASTLALELQDAAGGRVTSLDVVHTKQLHLIVVSPDLSFFAHVHPEPRPDGTFAAALTLPHPATYVAFADFKPAGSPQAVARTTVAVAGAPAAPKPLEASTLPARGTFDGFEVTVRSKAPLAAGVDAILEFEIFEKGAAVSDLQDYLGARGHCVIISEDTNGYLHSHPLGSSGSKVQFHTTMPAAGKYKVWAEFRPGGKPLLASFVIDVPAEAAVPKEEPHGHDHGPGGHSH